MSRCLPFPPPGYVKMDLKGDALLKHQKMVGEKTLSRKKRKERRKKRKMKLGRKDVTRIRCEDEEVGQKRCNKDKGKRKYDAIINGEKKKDKRVREHEDGGKRKKQKLSGRKNGTPSVSVNGFSDKSKLDGRCGKQKPSVSPSKVMAINTNHGMDPKHDTDQGGMLELELEYKKLMVNIPPPLNLRAFQFQTSFEDEEWWISKENVAKKSERTKTEHVSAGIGINQGIQPHARYLPDADIYALPYTVPF